MKQHRSYRIKTPTMAILSTDGHRVIVTVPVNVVIRISQDPREGDRLIDVVWNNKNYMMFTQDLRERAEPIDD